jgi:type IV pilus assembly protein PilN
MTLINLLPHRAAAKKGRQDLFQRQLGYCALLGFLLALAVYLTVQQKITAQQQKNQILVTDTAQLDKKIQDMSDLQKELQALLVRQHAVEDLQRERNTPVHLMNDLAKHLPEGLYMTSLRMDPQGVTLKGVSPSNEKVADFLQNLGADSTRLYRPELLEVVGGLPSPMAAASPFAARKVVSFSVRLHSRSPSPSVSKPSMTPQPSGQQAP